MESAASPYEQYYLHTETLSVVMPAYNEGSHIYGNLLQTSRELAVFATNYEIILVNDGSLDNTGEEAGRAASEDSHIRVISYEPNRGKGAAIKEGILNAMGEYIAFCDADLDLSPSQLQSFLYELEKQDADIAIGSKMHRDSRVDYPVLRKIMSLGYYTLLRMLFQLHTKDTQTGLKLFRGDTIKPIMEHIETNGYAFDIEILATAARHDKKIIEMPVEVVFSRKEDHAGSRIRIGDILKMFSDTLAIRKKLGGKSGKSNKTGIS